MTTVACLTLVVKPGADWFVARLTATHVVDATGRSDECQALWSASIRRGGLDVTGALSVALDALKGRSRGGESGP